MIPELEGRLPAHVGVVMDGNGRWARERGLPRVMGHHAGVKAVERVVQAAKDRGIRCLSLYAFSTENWKRPQGEVLGLMGLFRYYLRAKLKRLQEERARLRFAGRLEDLPEDIQQILAESEEATRSNDAITVVICINYGGRQEVLDAVNRILRSGSPDPLDDASFRRFLYLPDLPDPDLLIRSSGELRMSNFWLYQGAYSEYYFSPLYWPDFGPEEFGKALRDYASRERRYGDAGTR